MQSKDYHFLVDFDPGIDKSTTNLQGVELRRMDGMRGTPLCAITPSLYASQSGTRVTSLQLTRHLTSCLVTLLPTCHYIDHPTKRKNIWR